MTNNIETVSTPDLRDGDIVRTYGMRVLLSNRTEYGADMHDRRTVVHFDGRVLNPEEVDAAIVPVSFRTDDRRPEFARGEYWAIQGNDLARWSRETR